MSALQRDMTAELAALPEITLSPDSEPPAQRGIRVLHMADQTLTPVGLYVAMIDYAHQLRGADKGIRRLVNKNRKLREENEALQARNNLYMLHIICRSDPSEYQRMCSIVGGDLIEKWSKRHPEAGFLVLRNPLAAEEFAKQW